MSLDSLKDYVASAGAILALLSTVAGYLFAARSQPEKFLALANAREEEEEARDVGAEVRLPEITRLLEAEETRKGRLGFASASLAFGQFIIGGLLASSFIAENLSKALVGFLGLLVLAASLVHQHFRPDVLQKATAQKVVRLKALRRWAEDEVYDIVRREIDDERVLLVRRKVTEALDEIDRDGLHNEKGKKA